MTIPVEAVGERARFFLSPGGKLTVLGRTSRALFLLVEDEVLWTTGADGPLHGRALRAARIPRWSPGSLVVVQENTLGVGEETLFLGKAWVWQSPALPKLPLDLRSRARGLRDSLFPYFTTVSAVLGSVWLARCGEALSAQDFAAFLEIARDRIGRGPGLTPLADDFLGGTLFALRALAPRRFAPVREEFLALAKVRTNRLSFCLLADLSQGHGPEPLHAFVDALFAGQEERAHRWAWQLLTLGRSTGTGLLYGVLTVWAEVPRARSEEWRI